MSIYISGVEMPKEHPLYITLRPDGSVHVWDSYNGDSYGTQAIYVPDHGRLIDADMMEKECCHGCKNEFHKYENCIDCVLANAPTIIPADKEG